MKKTGTITIIIVTVLIVVGIIVFVERDNSLTANPANSSQTTPTATDQSPDTTATSTTTNNAVTATTTTPSMDQTAATTTTATGLQITQLAAGHGTGAVNGDSISVNYTGSLQDGTVFDSNTDPKFGHVQPFQFTLGAGQVIAGWDQGLVGAKEGEELRLVIPASLGYGASGAGASIPPNATLTFDVQVVSISHS